MDGTLEQRLATLRMTQYGSYWVKDLREWAQREGLEVLEAPTTTHVDQKYLAVFPSHTSNSFRVFIRLSREETTLVTAVYGSSENSPDTLPNVPIRDMSSHEFWGDLPAYRLTTEVSKNSWETMRRRSFKVMLSESIQPLRVAIAEQGDPDGYEIIRVTSPDGSVNYTIVTVEVK